MHAYCLFCETQRCETIAKIIESSMNIRCISPQIIQRKWIKGIPAEKSHPWLPGYIFLYTEEPIQHAPHIPGIIRLLGNNELHGSDLAFANMILTQHGTIGTIQLLEAGQYCTISAPIWQQIEGKVIKIDRGRKRCCIEFKFDNTQRTVWVGYEMIKPNQE